MTQAQITAEYLDGRKVSALVFDLDGTLYRQRPVRRAMLLRLLSRGLIQPWEAVGACRALRAYRQAQETLRHGTAEWSDLAGEQIRVACRSTGLAECTVTRHVAQWMEEAPLGLLTPAMRAGVGELLQAARNKGLRLAVWSDYPACRKLEAMGLRGLFDVVVSAQDPNVQRFKPDPRGLEVALARLGVPREEALYLGDRPEVDGEAATRAGVRFLLVGEAAPGPRPSVLSSFTELARAIG